MNLFIRQRAANEHHGNKNGADGVLGTLWRGNTALHTLYGRGFLLNRISR